MPQTIFPASALGNSAGTTADAAAAAALALTDRCEILENRGGPNGMGGYLDDWQVLQADVPCAVVAKTPNIDRTEGEKITAIGIYDFTMPSDVTISPVNRIGYGASVFVLQDRSIPIALHGTITVRARLLE